MQNQPIPSELEPGDPWLTLPEAVEYTKCGVYTIRRAYTDGRLSVTTTGPGKNAEKRFRRSWLDAWLESRAVGGEA